MSNKIFVAALLFFSFLIPSPAQATGQVAETLIYLGQEYGMFSCPDIPQDDPRIRKLSNDELREKISNKTFPDIVYSTACWRQYIGTWEIKDDRLYLTEIIGKYEIIGKGGRGGKTVKTNKSPIFAEWFSGELRLPIGERLKYIHMGFNSVYEKDILMQVENGVVIETKIIDNRK